MPLLEARKTYKPFEYPWAYEFWKRQQQIHWMPEEVPLGEDCRDWIAGGDYSIADMATQPWAYYVERHGFDPADYPALVEWRSRIEARPAVQRALARAQEAFDEVANRTRKGASAEDLDKFFGRTATVPETDYSAVKLM
jgi:hypothetical protein